MVSCSIIGGCTPVGDGKWNRRLTTRQRRRYKLSEQITIMTKYHKEKESLIRRGVLNGTILSVFSDTAATLSCAPTVGFVTGLYIIAPP